ncbi:MAG: ABC transporter substrate-binding protein [Clostridiales bacterium]|jgi:peptide/nickel transport system substrate-binding protein|nr:ABC transporter substrate-binding protein [Clostridiales bacterium]
MRHGLCGLFGKILPMIAALAILSGCAGNRASDSIAAASTSPSAGEPVQSASENSGETEAPEQVLKIARDFEGASFDPAAATTANDYMFAPMVFERLLTYDSDFIIQPMLAEEWAVSEDRLAYTFKLRKGVQFHRGYGELTSGDVKFSFERLADPELNAASNYANLGVENMASIETPDNYTVVITLKEEDPNFLIKTATYYGNIVSQKAFEDIGGQKFGVMPVGTGPFECVEGAILGERNEVIRFEDYWGEKALLDRMTFQLVSEPGTMFNAFEAGEVDLINITDYDKLEQYRSQPEKYNIYMVTSRSMLYVGNNMALEPFTDARVREAMFYAIDRDSLINDFYLGFPNPARSILPSTSMFSIDDYWDPEYDLEKAKRLLAEAGFPNGFTTEFYCPNDSISMGPATIIQSQLASAGINAQLQTVDFGVFLDKVRAGEAPLWLLFNDTNIVPDNTLSRYTSEYYPGSNWSGIMDADYDAAVKAALSETDESKRAALYADAQRKLIDMKAVYTVCDSEGYNVTAAKVKGFDFSADLTIRFDKVYITE